MRLMVSENHAPMAATTMGGMTAAAFHLPSRFWAELSTRAFAQLKASGQAAQTVAVLQGVIDAALPQLPAELPVLFLPPQNLGLSPEHLRFAGTLTLSPATVI